MRNYPAQQLGSSAVGASADFGASHFGAYGCPPSEGMGDIFSDLWGSVQEGAQSEIDRIISDAPGQIVGAITGQISQIPEVQAGAIAVAERGALDSAMAQLQDMKNQLNQQLTAVTQATGLSAPMLIGLGVAAVGGIIYMVVRK